MVVLSPPGRQGRRKVKQMNMGSIRRATSFIAVFLAAAGAAIVILATHRSGSRDKPDAPVDRDTRFFDRPATGGVAAANRSIAFPQRVDVSAASISQSQPAQDGIDPPAMADVGSPALPPSGADASAKSDDSQSAAELIDMRLEPTHPVAPVPVQDDGLAAVKATLAMVSAPAHRTPLAMATVHAAFSKTAPHLAVIVHASTRPSQARIGDIGNQLEVANSQQRSAVALAGFGAPAVSSNAAVPRGWPMTDETPMPDPSSLLPSLATDDPLKVFAPLWGVDAAALVSITQNPSIEAIDAAIVRSSDPWRTLYEMGRISAFLDAHSFQQSFWKAAVLRNDASPPTRPVMPEEMRAMEVLAGTCLWVWKDNALATKALQHLLQLQKLSDSPSGQTAALLAGGVQRIGGGSRR
jgi:hypothetical protein